MASNDPKLTYATDGLYSTHNCDFIKNSQFQKAYTYGLVNARPDIAIQWRVHTALWVASQCIQLDGDFVECGVHTGILSGAVLTWLNFSEFTKKTYYLLDTFEGIPEDQISESEMIFGVGNMNRKYPKGDATYLGALEKFSLWSNAKIIRGRVPETLAQVASDRIAYLSIDMNAAEPEIAAAEYFWPRLLPGAMILLDDYGWSPHIHQKQAFDQFALRHNIQIMSLPTGQGLIMKPHLTSSTT
jgi:O-methyltransferase